MASITVREAKRKFTKAIVDSYRERVKVMSFLRSFFPSREYNTLEISVEVIRGTEKIAIDVMRGSQGNANKFERSTERIYIPPFFREYFTISALDGYQTLFGATAEYISAEDYAIFVNNAVEKLEELVTKIERAYELQCAQVLETGIVTMNNGDNIDFKRKAGSLLDKTSETWATGTNDPRTHLKQAGDFLRASGKIQGGTLNAIMGDSAYNALLNNAKFASSADIRNITLDTIRPPQRNSTGGVLQGQVSAGSYNYNIWTYPEGYDNANDVFTRYVNDKKVIVLPENPRFQLAFAGTPFVDGEGDEAMAGVRKGAFQVGKYVDKRGLTIDYDVMSAGLAIPTAIDQVVTLQVLA